MDLRGVGMMSYGQKVLNMCGLWLLFWGQPVKVLAQGNEVEGLRDIHGPVAYPRSFWLVIAFVILGLLCLGLAIRYYRKRKKKAKYRPASIPTAPWVLAYEQLDVLRQEGLLERDQYNLFYSRLSEIVRHYLSNRFSIKAPEMTTEEFLIYLKRASVLTDVQKSILMEFSLSSDLVKFAKHAPTMGMALTRFNEAKRLVDETKEVANPVQEVV